MKKKSIDGLDILVNKKASKKAGNNTVVNSININLTKPRRQKVIKENLVLAEQKLQDLEQRDLEYRRNMIPFLTGPLQNPNVFGFNRSELQNLQQRDEQRRNEYNETQKKGSEQEPIRPLEEDFFRNANPIQVGRSGLSVYQEQYTGIPETSDFQSRLTEYEPEYVSAQVSPQVSETEPDRLNRLARELKQAKKDETKRKRQQKAEEKKGSLRR